MIVLKPSHALSSRCFIHDREPWPALALWPSDRIRWLVEIGVRARTAERFIMAVYVRKERN